VESGQLGQRSTFRLARSIFFLAAFVLGFAASCGAQQAAPPPGIPRFEIPASGLEWRAPVHPLGYFDATGHRAGVFGRQTGQFEAWIYPIKLLHGFRLEFRQEGMIEPVRGEALLEEIITRPESTTLVYVHPRFTVREIIIAPLDEPAVVVLFDVDSDKPLMITAKFVPDFKPMWPAGMGGQHSFWMEQDKAFGLSDGTYKPTAMIGSPTVGGFTDFTDHQLIGGEMVLQMRADAQPARKMLLPLVMSLSMESQATAQGIYRSVLARLRELYEGRVKYDKEFLGRTMQLETPDAELNRAFAWAKVAIDAGWVRHPTYGRGLVAGYGPSGDGERPGFAWWFGGDALMSTWALEDYGDVEGALQALRFLKARQRADGKMMHEMTQSVGLIDWFGKYPFAYSHADTTPMYLYSLGEYWERTGDRKFLEEFWPSAKKAYEYCLSTVDPVDGLMDNTKAGLAAVEVGPLRGKVVKDIYLEGFWLAGLSGMASLAQAKGDVETGQDAASRLSTALKSLDAWWDPDGKFFAFGMSADGKRADMAGNWPSVAVAFGAGRDAAQRADEGERLASPDLATDWGTRWLSNRDPLYDPVSYNNGTAWPFMNVFVTQALERGGASVQAFSTVRNVAVLTGIQSPGHMPEHMNGDRLLPGERSVPHQLFSAVGVVVPMVRDLLGLQAVHADHVRFSPRLPANWASLRFSNYYFLGGRLSGEITQRPNALTITLNWSGNQPLSVELNPALPVGAGLRRVVVDGKPVQVAPPATVGDATYVLFHITVRGHTSVVIEHEGGVGIVPPAASAVPGERSSSLRILRVESTGRPAPREMILTVAGLGSHSYALDLVTAVASLTAEGVSVQKTEKGYRLEIPFEGAGYVTRTIRLHF
jgi:hypothetical protein